MAIPTARQRNDRSPGHGEQISVAGLRHDLGISRERMARLLDVARQTVERDESRPHMRLERTTTTAQAVLVPSVAVLDDLARRNLVIFLDRMPDDTRRPIPRVEHVSPLR